MKPNQLRILNVIIWLLFIILVIIKAENFDGDFYQTITVLCLLLGISEVYLYELKDEE